MYLDCNILREMLQLCANGNKILQILRKYCDFVSNHLFRSHQFVKFLF